MKRFRSDRYGFEILVPDYWSCPSSNAKAELIFKSRGGLLHPNPSEFMSIEINLLTSRQSLKEIEHSFLEYASRVGHIDIRLGIIQIKEQEHFWARYLISKSLANKISVGREIISSVKGQYSEITYGWSDEFFVDELYNFNPPTGPVIKHYLLVLGQTIYDIKCALGCGTVSEIEEEFKDKEETYDEVVSTFSLIH